MGSWQASANLRVEAKEWVMGTLLFSARAMKQFSRWFAVLLLTVAAGASPALSNGELKAQHTAVCGPQQYCARTDRRVEPYPEKPPAIGPAGSMISDPTFGSRILRVTDGRSDPAQAGRPLFTPSSAEQNSWNKNSTMFYVSTSGGSILLYDFDPETMRARPAQIPGSRFRVRTSVQFPAAQPPLWHESPATRV